MTSGSSPGWLRRFGSSWELRLALLCLGVLVVSAVCAPWLHSGGQTGATAVTWSAEAPLREQLGWWAMATRRVLLAVSGVLAVALPAGCLLGAIAALGPRVISGLLTRAVELSGALPSLIAVGLWQLALGTSSLASFVGIVILLKGIETARLVSDQTARVMRQPYVTAAMVLGSSKRRTFRVHVLPQLWPALAVNAGSTAAYVVGLEGALSFVGLGPSDGLSWGALLGQAVGRSDVSWGLVWTCLASITLTTLSLYTLCRPRSG